MKRRRMERGFEWRHAGKNIVVALSLLAAGFFAAWLRFEPHLGREGAFTDGRRNYDTFADEPIRYAVWETPQMLGGDVQSAEGEHRPSVSPDGRWLVFVSGERGTNSELYLAELQGGVALDPRPLYELNSTYDELAPAFGEGCLYFASNRPAVGGFDLWSATFDGDGTFGAPVLLDAAINTTSDELDPAPLPGQDALAFASNRRTAGRVGHDFYLAEPGADGSFEVRALESLNSWQDDRELTFTADGRQAFLASDRDGARGAFDLYASLNEHGAWIEPQALEGLNSPAVERAPAAGRNGFELYFERQALATNDGDVPAANLFHARSLEVFQRPGPRVGLLDILVLIALLVLALLAWLAKRWDAIEVLYKCFLVSLLVHGAMLWWFRDIHPEPEVAELPTRSAAYSVQLAHASEPPASFQERAGALEVEARQAQASEAIPARMEQRAQSELAQSNPRAAQLARASAPSESSEAREVQWTPEEQAARSALALQDAVQVEREALGVAAAAALRAAQTSESNARPSQPTNSPLQAQRAPARERELEPVGRTLQRSAAQDEALALTSTAPGEAELVPSSSTTDARAQAVRAPAETGAADRVAIETTRASAPAVTAVAPHAASADARGLQPLAPTRTRQRSTRGLADTHLEPQAIAMQTQPKRRLVPEIEGPARASAEVRRAPAAELLAASLPQREIGSGLAPERVAIASTSAVQPQALTPRSTSRARTRRGSPAATSELQRPVASVQPASLELAPRRTLLDTDNREQRSAPMDTTIARLEHTPYRTRFGPAKARALEEHGGSTLTEAAVRDGLDYLASVQTRGGSWGDARAVDEKYGEVRVGKTGLCLLAFLGAGHTPFSNSEHSDVAKRAVQFLLSAQRNNGHFGKTASYGHGIATYAVAETYALSGHAELREPLQRAVAEILRYQHREQRDRRRFGGWGYYNHRGPTHDNWPRASITAWQVMALESARLGGLEVPDRAFEDARTFLEGCLDERRGSFRYSHDPARLNSAWAILPGSTPASLFALSLLGADLETPEFRRAWQFVTQRAPQEYRYRGDEAFVQQAQGNLYFWYYGSLASMRAGGSTWKRWNVGLQEALLPSQRSDGSWEPISVYARKYARDIADDASYSTAMNVLSLEVYYRYFTPLLKVGR